MLKNSILLFVMLSGLAISCGGDGEGHPGYFDYIVFNGEAPPIDGQIQRAPNATVKVYQSAQAWLDGQAPLKTFTTNAQGEILRANDKFPDGSVAYAESGSLNNWPEFLRNPLSEDPNYPDRRTGGSTLYETFMQNFLANETKIYLLTDLWVNGSSVFGSVADCSKDNFLKLKRNGDVLYSEGTDVCAGKEATTDFELIHNSVNQTAIVSMHSRIFYDVYIYWADVNNRIYIKTDFTEIWFKVNVGSNEQISIYTRQ